MKRLTLVLFVASLFLVAGAAFAGDDGAASSSTVEIKRNLALLQAALDTDISLYALERLDRSAQAELVQFHEYRLDRVVCETSQLKEHWKPSQKKLMLSRFKQIKAYWRAHSRVETPGFNAESVSTFLPAYKPETAVCAEKVLRDM